MSFLLVFALLVGCNSAGSGSSESEIPPEETPEATDETLQKALLERQKYHGKEPFFEPGMSISVEVNVQGKAEQVIASRKINQQGEINLPLVQRVKVGNMTRAQIESKLVEAYSAYYVNPNVLVKFVGNEDDPNLTPWGYVTILGYVATPGRVAMTPGAQLYVSSALQKAGGYQQGTKLNRIQIFRAVGEGARETIEVDIKKFGRGRGDDFELKRGDVIWVSQSAW